MEDSPLIRLEGISKYFGKVRANSHIDLDIRAGRIKALLGENGAGKSTLMSILAGRLEPDTGRIFVEGQARRFRSPKDAHLAGIGMVYQHFMLVDTMSVAENVLLGHEGSFVASPGRMRERVRELAEGYGLAVDPAAGVGALSMGERQRVEILKLICRECRVLIFDEPTAVLTPAEAERLFAAMRRMAAQGKAVVFISHKLPEVLSVADEVAILRRGEVVDVFERSQVPDEAELARRMLGRDLLKESGRDAPAEEALKAGQASFAQDAGQASFAQDSGQASSIQGAGRASVTQAARDLRQVLSELPLARLGVRGGRGRRIALADPVLALSDLSCRGSDTAGFSNVSFAISKGQILALVGVAGNGQKELVEAICGLRRPDAGTFNVLGLDYREFFSELPDLNGLGYIPEDRRGVASCPDLSLVDNFLLTARKLFSRRGLLDRKRALRATKALLADHNIVPGNPQARGRELSGGNLQKLVVGRELLRNPRCIVAENPTQGLDVAAAEEVWRRLRVARESSGILLVTGDVAEALALADYIAVIYRGRIVDLFSAANQEKVDRIGLMMAGGG